MENIAKKIKELALRPRENITLLTHNEKGELWFTGDDSIGDSGISFFAVHNDLCLISEINMKHLIEMLFKKHYPSNHKPMKELKKNIIEQILEIYWASITLKKEKKNYVWKGIIPKLVESTEILGLFCIDLGSVYRYEWEHRYYIAKWENCERYEDLYVINILEFMKNWWENWGNKENPFENTLIDLTIGHNASMNLPTLITQQPDKTPLSIYEKEYLKKHRSQLSLYVDIKNYL